MNKSGTNFEEPTFSGVRLFLVLIQKVDMKISGSKVFRRFLFERAIPKLAREQNRLSKTFIYYDNKLAVFIWYTH